MVRGIVVGVCLCACGCVESQLEANMNASFGGMGNGMGTCNANRESDALPTIQTHAALVPPVDTFWAQEVADRATQPPIEHARSISLGYVGDTPLTGGVMRDTPMEAPQYGGYPASNYMQYAPSYPTANSYAMMGGGGRGARRGHGR